MKKRLILMVLLVAVLVLGTVFAAYAKSGGRITGAMKAVYEGEDGTGWNWLQINVDASIPDEPSGFIKYKSWTLAPNEWGYWRAEPICVSFGEFMEMPAASIVSQFTESSDPLAGYFSKGIFVDGGTNAKNDLIVLAWSEFLLEEQPDCGFAIPDDHFYWSGVGGNITIHNP